MALLKQYRKEANLTLVDAATLLKISETTLWRWEEGLTQPDRLDLCRINKIYKLTKAKMLSLLSEKETA